MASDTEPGKAVLEVVGAFAKELAEVKQAGEQGRKELRIEIEAQLTAVRHDVFGSVVYLSQQLIDLRTTVQGERDDAKEWRTVERQEREYGRKVNRLVFVGVAILAIIALLRAFGAF